MSVITFDADQLHRVLCWALLKKEPEHGTKAAVSRALGIAPQHYNRALTAEYFPFRTIAPWCSAAGVRIVVEAEFVRFEILTWQDRRISGIAPRR